RLKYRSRSLQHLERIGNLNLVLRPVQVHKRRDGPNLNWRLPSGLPLRLPQPTRRNGKSQHPGNDSEGRTTSEKCGSKHEVISSGSRKTESAHAYSIQDSARHKMAWLDWDRLQPVSSSIHRNADMPVIFSPIIRL